MFLMMDTEALRPYLGAVQATRAARLALINSGTRGPSRPRRPKAPRTSGPIRRLIKHTPRPVHGWPGRWRRSPKGRAFDVFPIR